MNFIMKLTTFFLAFCLFSDIVSAQDCVYSIPNYSNQIQKENLNRGLVAMNLRNNKIMISWRYLLSDSPGIGFDLYRKTKNGKAQKLNWEPIIKASSFIDAFQPSNDITYSLTFAGNNQTLAEYKLTSALSKLPYLSIPMQPVAGDTGWRYSPNDASVGDLDGDGEYELVIKRENKGFDNSHRGLCSGGPLLEAYRLNGTFMWRVDLGENIRQGAHYSPFMVYDFDGDGKAEIAVRTSERTRFGDGTTINDTDNDSITDYVDRNPHSATFGMITKGPEFLSVIEGLTGKELARTSFISRGRPGEFGDSSANRSDRFLGGAGYFDGIHPSILICRGYYAKTVLETWDFMEGKLTKRWRFDSSAGDGKNKAYEGQGNHNFSIGDVDGDGKDEITYGACLIDDDGSGGYNTLLGHGDALQLTDIDIDRGGLEVWDCHESAPSRAGSELRDSRTGQLLWGIPSVEDVGRALAADIDPRFRGCEVWTLSSEGVYTASGKHITERLPSINYAIWWDGDLNRELLDGSGVTGKEFIGLTKWNGDGVDKIELPAEEELATNNWTKANPCLQADILGDWREEIITRTKNNREVRIFISPYETPYRFHPLMSDIMYRMSVLSQNSGYNQPPQMSFYLGSDLGKFWPRSYISPYAHNKSGITADNRPNGMNARMKDARLVIQNQITCSNNSYTFDAGYTYDSYTWLVDGKQMKAGRKLTLTSTEFGINREIKVKLKASIHGCEFEEEAKVVFTGF